MEVAEKPAALFERFKISADYFIDNVLGPMHGALVSGPTMEDPAFVRQVPRTLANAVAFNSGKVAAENPGKTIRVEVFAKTMRDGVNDCVEISMFTIVSDLPPAGFNYDVTPNTPDDIDNDFRNSIIGQIPRDAIERAFADFVNQIWRTTS